MSALCGLAWLFLIRGQKFFWVKLYKGHMNGLRNYLTVEAQFLLIWHAVEDLKHLNPSLNFS